MRLKEDIRRLLAENLRQSWKRYSAVFALAFAWYPAYSVAGIFASQKLYKLLIAGSAYAAGGVGFVFYFMFSSLRSAYAKLAPEAPDHKYLAELSGIFFGIQKKIHALNVLVLADGSSESVNDIKLIAHARNVTQIEYHCETPSVPTDAQGHVEISAEPRVVSGVRVGVEVLRSGKTECFWSINFVPALKPRQVVSYRFRQKVLPGAYARTEEEMRKRKLEYEYYSRCITYPTERLHLRVTFCDELTPQRIAYDVWLGKGRVRHMPEYVRLDNDSAFRTDQDEDGRVYGELHIPAPIQGLRYVLTWVPPKGASCQPEKS